MVHGLQWYFPEGGSNVGFNIAGLRHFVGDTGLFREVVQNSLDARHPDEDLVIVELERMTLPVEDLDGKGLLAALKRCLKSKWLNTDEGREQFSEAVRVISEKTIPVLSITDVNTTGASAESEPSDVSKWEGLTDSEGIAVGKGAMSGGSYGLGKHAPFSATPLRTVLYSTCYTDNNGGVQRRFIGRAMLVTHKNVDGYKLSHNGYLGNGREPLSDDQVPDQFRMKTPGTRVLIPGWDWSSTSGWGWDVGALDVITEHYFYAVLHGSLGVTIEQKGGRGKGLSCDTLDSSTLRPGGAVYRLLEQIHRTPRKRKTLRYVTVSTQKPIATRYIPDVGDVDLRIDVDLESGRRDLALVRHPGVKITDIAGNMGVANPRIPYGWQNFTAVVSITPRDRSDWVVRDCESPTHDTIDVGRAGSRARQQKARNALREMGEWIRDEIEKVASSPPENQISESYELHKHGLTITASGTDSTEDGNGSQGQRQLRLVPDRVIKSAPQSAKSTVSGGPRQDTAVDSDHGEEEEAPRHVPEGGPTPEPNPQPGPENEVTPQRRVIRPTQYFDLEPVFTPVSDPYGNIATHSLRVSLCYPDQSQDLEIEVRPVGEDGSRPTLGLMEVVVGAEPARIIRDKQAFLLPAARGDKKTRENVVVKFNEPIANRSFMVSVSPVEPVATAEKG